MSSGTMPESAKPETLGVIAHCFERLKAFFAFLLDKGEAKMQLATQGTQLLWGQSVLGGNIVSHGPKIPEGPATPLPCFIVKEMPAHRSSAGRL